MMGDISMDKVLTRPHTKQDAGMLWLHIAMKDGVKIDAVVKNDLLMVQDQLSRGSLEVHLRGAPTGKKRKMITVWDHDVETIVVLGVIGVKSAA